MNAFLDRKLLFAGLSLATALLLASCGESTNIEAGSSTTTDCSSLTNVTCVSGRFIDDAAVGIDYECELTGVGKVVSVTGSDGGFSCPSGSTATFSLTNPDDTSAKIVLGTISIFNTAAISGGSGLPVYFYVTPRSLAGDSGSSGFSYRSVNITRLLQTLNEDPLALPLSDTTNDDLPSRRVIITADTKRKITTAIADAVQFGQPPGDAATLNTFDNSVQDLMAAFTPAKALIGEPRARTLLTKAVYSAAAGVYESYDPFALAGNANSAGMTGAQNNRYFVGSFWQVVDRRGRMIGSGTFSFETDPETLLFTNAKTMALTSTQWPLDGNMAQMAFSVLNGSGVATGDQVKITQGVMRREAVAGSSEIYENLFSESADDLTLGKWTYQSGASTLISSGAVTVTHQLAVATSMNWNLWKPSRISFPLGVTLTFRDSDLENSSAGCEVDRGCVVGGPVRIAILQDGNIISDFSGKCGAGIDPATLLYSGNPTPEIPLGVVRSIQNEQLDGTGSAIETITLLGMIPNDSRYRALSSYLPFIQFGSNRGDYSQLEIGGANNLKSIGLCTQARKDANLCTTVGAFEPGLARWVNMSTTNKAFTSGVDADAYNAGGYIEATPSTCVP